MVEYTVSDEPFRPPGTGNIWRFFADGKSIGKICETTDGYRGYLFTPKQKPGEQEPGEYVFAGHEMPFRPSVVVQLTRAAERLRVKDEQRALILKARAAGLVLVPADFGIDAGELTLAGMPAAQFIEEHAQD